MIVHLVARSAARNLQGALGDALNQVEGAYSLLVLTRDEIYAIRDPRGFRPLSLGTPRRRLAGRLGNLRLRSGRRRIRPRSRARRTAAHLQEPASNRSALLPHKPPQYCIFEHVYFARPDSLVFGRPWTRAAKCWAELLAREQPADADVVVPVPDSGVPAAVGYALESGLPFRMGLIRNHYIGRTFIEPEQAIRDFGVKLKLNPVRTLLEGKRVVLVDDSIVRGTTSRKIVRMVREAGATEVHVRISCPPTVSPCYYGIDTPTREELLASEASRIRPRLPERDARRTLSASERTLEEIRLFLGADSVGYLSLESLRRAVGDTSRQLLHLLLHRHLSDRMRAARSDIEHRAAPSRIPGMLDDRSRRVRGQPS